MTAGEFTKINAISLDTLHYYIKEGMLLPLKEGKYVFGTACQNDLDKIQQWKEYGLKLNTIRKLIKTRRIYGEEHPLYRAYLIPILEEKLQQNTTECRNWEEMANSFT